MDRISRFIAFVAITASVVCAFPNLRIDGAETVVVSPPQNVLITADFSEPGQSIAFRLYVDNNGDRIPETIEMKSFFKIIDGIPPIGWIDGEHITGDLDSAVNSEMSCRITIDMSVPITPVPLDTVYFFLVALDEGDSSSDTAIIKVLPPEPVLEPVLPYIYGNVYSAIDSSNAIYPAFCIYAGMSGDPVMTDSSGRYFLTVPQRDSTYIVQVVPLDGDHIVANSMITVGASDDSVRLDLFCNSLEQRIRGNITLDGETPVPGFFIILALNTVSFNVAATIHDQVTGEYRVPAVPGSTVVGFLDFENFPAGYFPYPVERRLDVPFSGDVTGVDFDLQPLDAAISGTVIDSSVAGDAENEGLWIYADGGDYGDFTARTDRFGNYLIPVKGTTTETYRVTLETFGYDVNPWVHDHISVGVGDTVTDNNFILGEAWIRNRISGSVLDSDLDPVEGSIVVAQNKSLAFKKAWQMTFTDSVGEFSFEKLPPLSGKWLVGTYNDSLGYTEPRVIIVNRIPSDTTIADANFVFSLSGIDEFIPHRASEFSINSIYPNPFNSIARAKIAVNEDIANIDISLFDILGRKRKTMLEGAISKGEHIIEIDCRGLSSGIYFLRMNSGKSSVGKEVLFIK